MPEKLHSCVRQVMAKGHSEKSAYAICNASIAQMSAEPTDAEVGAALDEYARRKVMLAKLTPGELAQYAAHRAGDHAGKPSADCPMCDEGAADVTGPEEPGDAGGKKVAASAAADVRPPTAPVGDWEGLRRGSAALAAWTPADEAAAAAHGRGDHAGKPSMGCRMCAMMASSSPGERAAMSAHVEGAHVAGRVAACRACALGAGAPPVAAKDAALAAPDETPGALSAAAPVEIRVIVRNPDGSGVVELPIAVETPRLDFSRTAGGGAKDGRLTLDDLRQMEANFPRTPGPVRVDAGHHIKDEDAHGPAPGFMESLRLTGKELWARLRLGARLMGEVLRNEWAGFSIDAAQDRRLPTATLAGWSVKRGVLTNSPALDVNFKVGAALEECAALSTISLSIRAHQGGPEGKDDMAEQNEAVQLATARAELAQERDARVELERKYEATRTHADEIQASLDSAETRNAALVVELNAAQALKVRHEDDVRDRDKRIVLAEAEKAALREKVAELETVSLTERVQRVINRAINRGVNPAMFDGADRNPAGWMRSQFATFEAFENLVNNAPTTASLSRSDRVSSGAPRAGADDAEGMSAARRENLASLGLKAEYAGITSESQLATKRAGG